MDQPILSKKIVRKSKALKKATKESSKRYIKGHTVRAKINKVVTLASDMPYYYDCSEDLPTHYKRSENMNFMERIKNGNLYGLSGDGYPVYDKLKGILAVHKESRILIINAVECEPGLLHDEWLLTHRMEQIKEAASIVSLELKLQKCILATKLPLKRYKGNMSICYVCNRYPMGEEKLLIKDLLGIKLEPEEKPVSRGILVLNVQTMLAIRSVLCENKPLMTRYLTVANLHIGKAYVVKAKLNSNAFNVLEAVLGKEALLTPYCGGGVLMAHMMTKQDTITFSTNFLCYSEKFSYSDSAKCKGCMRCEHVCPMHIKIGHIIQAKEKGTSIDRFEEKTKDCLECGACSYFCSAGKNTKEFIAEIKKQYTL